MKTLVLYDSLYGNTGHIAQAIASHIGSTEDVALLRPSEVKPAQLTGLSLLVVGSPTQRFMATPALMAWLKEIPRDGLRDVRMATFDTRLTEKKIQETPVLKWFVRKSSYAAWWLAQRLKKKGGQPVLPPEGFYVEGMEGPLLPGELERAGAWAQQLLAAI
jgi:menaquinone-dependent protoporphyrinogen IX oxidase